jgi:hypothetical protein
VTIAGKQFYEAGKIGPQTKIITDLKREVALVANIETIKPLWEDNSGRQFIVLSLRGDRELLTGKPQQSSQPINKTDTDVRGGNTISSTPNEMEIENEPPAARLPPRIKWLGR